MTTESVERFFLMLSEDETLEEAYWSALEGATHQAIIQLAAECGLEFTTDDLKGVWEAKSAELDESDLEAVAGGTTNQLRRAQPSQSQRGFMRGMYAMPGMYFKK
jgi:predicted ribosomally synthesized peptide with nif11-like leader